MELLFTAIVAFVMGWRLSAAVNLSAFKRILQELGIRESDMRKLAAKNGIELPEPEQPAEQPLEEIHIKLEQHQGVIYAFRKDNDQFLGQGVDRDSLIERLRQRLNNVRLIVDEGGELLQKNNG